MDSLIKYTCSFTGHRPYKLPWKYDEKHPLCLALKKNLFNVTECLIREGIKHFLCGMAEGCDFYFCQVVLSLREWYPHISLEAVIPFLEQSDKWSWQQQEQYRKLLASCDKRTLIQKEYAPGCIQKRNRYLIEHSTMLIAAYDGCSGGTQTTIEYAMKQGLSIVNIPVKISPKNVNHPG